MDDYLFDDFNDGSEKLVGEQLLGKLSKFVDDYGRQLKEFEEALDDSLTEVWDLNADPIALNIQPYEQANVVQLVRTDNKVFNKVIITFAALCVEIQHLKEAGINKFYAPLKLFGEVPLHTDSSNHNNNSNSNNNNNNNKNNANAGATPATASSGGVDQEGEGQIMFGRILPLLQELSEYVSRCYIVCKNVMQQLGSLYAPNQKLFITSFKGVHLQTVFDNLSDLFTVLITLDEIILSNNNFTTALNMYKRMVKGMKSGGANRYNVSEDELWQLEKLLFALKGQLLDGRIFQNCIEQDFDTPLAASAAGGGGGGVAGVAVNVSSNAELKKEFFVDVKTMFIMITSRIGDSSETNQRYKFVGLTALYVFYITLYKDGSDKKFFKGLWEMQKRVSAVHLYGDVVWFSTEFIKKTIPMMLKVISNNIAQVVDQASKLQREYVKQLDTEFIQKIHGLYLQVSMWMVWMESNLSNRALETARILQTRVDLLIQGVRLAFAVSNVFKEVVGLHVNLGIPLKSQWVVPLSRCVELLKAIQHTFHRRSALIAQSVNAIVQALHSNIYAAFGPIKARLESGKKYNDAKLDVLAAVWLAMQMLCSASTKERRLILKLCMHLVLTMDFLKDEEVEEIKKWLNKLELVSELQELLLNQACETSWFWWSSRQMLPNYLAHLYAHPHQARKIHYMFASLRDCVAMLQKAQHQDTSLLLNDLKYEVFHGEGGVKKQIIDRLAIDIETDLRLHIHSHLEVADRNPFKQQKPLKDAHRFLSLPPLRLHDIDMDIKEHVIHYLDTTFYNLTTVSLNNWKTYGEMRNLAFQKYGLSLMEPHLPSQTLEQGIDVLEIMRKIHTFVAHYNYNLNNQIFIEKSSENKTINIINIGHIANSIRTHGVGIMNTTVNFIFQFLKQKFVIFSQFLFDDHIKSRLYRDIKFYKENRDTLDNKYPWERSLKFNKEIRKLGVVTVGSGNDQQKFSYLDQFRQLITEIGNAMGYIRMIRSGGFTSVSNAIKFLPDLQDILQFEECVKKENLSHPTQTAAHNLDQAIEALSGNFSSLTDYFAMLVQVFADEFRSATNMHLKNFFIIVPPLTINFVEHSLMGKEKLPKKGKASGAFFTDDGFAIGVAYILQLLDQYKQFDSLHWFEEVQKHFGDEQNKLQQEISKLKKEDQQTAQLSKARLRNHQMEFELLRFSFDGARVFFKY